MVSRLDVNLRILNLPEGLRSQFFRELTDDLYDNGWCEDNKIDYVKPDMTRVKEILLQQDKYKQK